jgi:hypothetical protein
MLHDKSEEPHKLFSALTEKLHSYVQFSHYNEFSKLWRREVICYAYKRVTSGPKKVDK